MLGARPLYYHGAGATLRAASTVRALRRAPGVGQAVNPLRLADYLAVQFIDAESTFFEGIRRLPPGFRLMADATGVRIEPYNDLTADLPDVGATLDVHAERFRALLERAVRARLAPRRRWGFLVSGGLDSSSILCLARRSAAWAQGEPLAWTVVFPGRPDADESRYLHALGQACGVAIDQLSAEALSPLGCIGELYELLDEPFHAPNLYVYLALAKAARQHDAEVLIDGVDGDTVVGHGLEYLAELVLQGRWRRALAEVRALARRTRQPAWRFFVHGALAPALATWRSNPDAAVRRCIPPLLRRELLRRLDYEDRLRALMRDRLTPARTLREHHRRMLTGGMIPYYLEVNDRLARALGLAHAHPFYDRRLVRFCLALPPEARLAGGWDRLVQRRAMEGVVPREIQWRVSKAYWGTHFERRLLEADRGRLVDLTRRSETLLADYIDAGVLRRSLERALAGHARSADLMNLWVAATLTAWLERRV